MASLANSADARHLYFTNATSLSGKHLMLSMVPNSENAGRTKPSMYDTEAEADGPARRKPETYKVLFSRLKEPTPPMSCRSVLRRPYHTVHQPTTTSFTRVTLVFDRMTEEFMKVRKNEEKG
jgi:hypothetical protein